MSDRLRRGRQAPPMSEQEGVQLMSPPVWPPIAIKYCAGSNSTDTAVLGSPCYHATQSIPITSRQGSVWVPTSHRALTPETWQKPHGTWFSENLCYRGVPGASLVTRPQCPGVSPGPWPTAFGYDSMTKYMPETHRLLVQTNEQRGSQTSIPRTVAEPCPPPRLDLRPTHTTIPAHTP